MAGGVAHDFNNLLATVLARAQLLQAQTADPHLRQGLQVIERAALDGAETVRRILGFARARPEARYARVDIGALLEQVLEVTRPRWKDEAQRHGAAIEAVLAVEPVSPVLGNAAELREVLVNLIFNAVDAMPRGGRLTLGARRLLRPGYTGTSLNPHRQVLADRVEGTHEVVELWVQDTGAGMPEAVRRRAFDPFFTTKGVRGTGLGLSVVYGIIQRHGGEVLLESQEAAGTTVIIRLPGTAEVLAPGAESGPPPPVRTARIVVVDDEEVLGTALAEILRLQRHRVEAFTDPNRALDYMAREPVDLLFTDLGMPDLSGLEMARQARTLRPDLPVILVTGWGHQVDAETLTAERVNALLAKPYRMEDVLHVVAEVLPPAPS
jgi:CheY-like chemotaxis protein